MPGETFFEGFANPADQEEEVLLDLEADLFGEAGQFGGQEGGDAEGLAFLANAAFPVLHVGLETGQRIVELLGE